MREITEKRSYTRYTNENKAKFFKLKIDKYMSTLAAAKQLCIHVCAAQRWVKQYQEDPGSIYDSKKQGRKCHLNEEHKKEIIKYIDSNPTAAIVDITEHLLYEFSPSNLKVSCSTVHSFIRTECNFPLKNAEFHSVERNSPDKLKNVMTMFKNGIKRI